MSIEDAAPALAAMSLDPFNRDQKLCLDGHITRPSVHPVAAGGYSDVWEGVFQSRRIAIKVVRPFSGSGRRVQQSKLLRRLWREYLAWSDLSHPNIIECLGFTYDFSPEGCIFPSLISPWMSGGTALSFLENHPDADCSEMLVGIAEGLSYLHTRDPPIIHGDLRAGNILVSELGVPCLSDFGLSRVLNEVRGMTTSTEIAGSLRWISPELFQADATVSIHSDIWAYGMTALEILSGERPYAIYNSDIFVFGQIKDGCLPSRPCHPRAIQFLSDDMWNICRTCWALQPTQRPSAGAIKSMLLDSEPPPPHLPPHPSPIPPQSRPLAQAQATTEQYPLQVEMGHQSITGPESAPPPYSSPGSSSEYNILAIDGGGVCGLSALIVLQDLMDRLKLTPELSGSPVLKPCDIFDLICGTSTGGLIAIMLGRLRMSVDEAIICYLHLSEVVFKEEAKDQTEEDGFKPMYDASILGRCVRDVVAQVIVGDQLAAKELDPKQFTPQQLADMKTKAADIAATAPLKDPLSEEAGLCRTFVVAAYQSAGGGTTRNFRSYNTETSADTCSIWEAARATTAMRPFFRKMTIGGKPPYGVNYLDGGSSANNPSRLAVKEGCRIFRGRSMGCLLSIGAGIPSTVSATGDKIKIPEVFKKLLENCERIHEDVGEDCAETEVPYFRFSASRSLGYEALDDWEDGRLASLTQRYMNSFEQRMTAKKCVKALVPRADQVSARRLQEKNSIRPDCRLTTLYV